MKEILNKQGDVILKLDANSWEYTYWSLLVTTMQLGMPTLSEKRCAQLLVWLFQFGGGYEAVTHNRKMVLDITFAQYHFNIYGSQIPEITLIKQYNQELMQADDFPDWCLFIFDKYNLKKCNFDVYGKNSRKS